MPPALRRAQILQRIQRDGGVSVAELARDHAVSPVTVHRDLEELAREGLVERVHGGARALGGDRRRAGDRDRLDAARGPGARGEGGDRRARGAPRRGTARRSSSTRPRPRWPLARRLVEDPPNELTLVTNSPAIAYEIQAEAMHVVVAPGELDQHMRMLAGRWTVEFLAS